MKDLQVKNAADLKPGDWIWGFFSRNAWPEWHGLSILDKPREFTGTCVHLVVLVGPSPMDLIGKVPARNAQDEINKRQLLKAHGRGAP